MLVHFGLDSLQAEWSASIVCLGTFDGVHLGHQRVISEAVAQARAAGLPCIVVTFDRHPAATLAPDRCPPAIASLEQRLERITELGPAATIILPFDQQLANTSAQDFLDQVLVEKLKATAIVAGNDFAIGKGREGTPHWLHQHLPTTILEALLVDGARVSSSAIRSAVAAGDVALAHRLMGHAFAIPGIVVGGQKLGRTLGFPTANIARSFLQVMPTDGVYAGVARTDLGSFLAAVSIGTRPTVPGAGRSIEAYLLDFPGESLYGKEIEVAFRFRLRDELRFDNLDALRVQMVEDTEQTRRLLA